MNVDYFLGLENSMKKLIGLLLIILVIILAGYYGMGYLTESTMKKSIVALNEKGTNGPMVKLQSYHRGWFTSQAVLDWTIYLPEHLTPASETNPGDLKPHQVTVPVKIWHGPFIFSSQGFKCGLGYAHAQVEMPSSANKMFNEVFTADSTRPNLDLDLFINFFKQAFYKIKLLPMALKAQQGDAVFDWSGLTLTFNVSPDMNSLKGQNELGALIFRANNNTEQGEIAPVINHYSLHRYKDNLYYGNADLLIPDVSLTKNNEKTFVIKKLELDSIIDIKNDLVNQDSKLLLKELFVQKRNYGPVKIELALRNLDANALISITNKLNQLQTEPSVFPAMASSQKLLVVLPDLPLLLSKGPEFEIKTLQFKLPEGELSGTLFLSLPQQDSSPLLGLVQKLQGRGEIHIPSVLLKQLFAETIKRKLLLPPPAAATDTEAANLSNKPTDAVVVPAPDTVTANNSDASLQAAAQAQDVQQQAVILADKRLESMMQSGLLTLENNAYTLRFTLDKGQLLVNGKPFQSEMIQF